MMLTTKVARAVASGEVTLAFRRWARPRVTAGSEFVSVAGLIRIESVHKIDPTTLTDDGARAAGATSVTDLIATFRGRDTDPIFRIELSWAGPDPRDIMSASEHLSDEDITEIGGALARLDRKEPWTHDVLRLIADRPGTRAADLATILGLEPPDMKLRVRKLKNLGLTRSLTTGYEISPRGAAWLAHS